MGEHTTLVCIKGGGKRREMKRTPGISKRNKGNESSQLRIFLKSTELGGVLITDQIDQKGQKKVKIF